MTDEGCGDNSAGDEGDASARRSRALLVSFAMIQVRWDDQNCDYIDNFVPFVAHCVKSSSPAVVATQDIQDQLKDRFGLVIRQHALAAVIKRATRKNFFRAGRHTLVPNGELLDSIDVDAARSRAERGYRQLLRDFRKFAEERHGRRLTDVEGDEAFITYITDRALPIVRWTLRGQTMDSNSAGDGEMDLIIADFILHLSTEDVEGFDLLDMIVRGCMLATALYLPDPNELNRRITDLTVYIDTPFIIDLLGLTDEAREAAARELVALLLDLGSRVTCFWSCHGSLDTN